MFKKYFGLRGQSLNYAISAIAGTDFLLFGYGEVNRRAHRQDNDLDMSFPMNPN